MESGFFNRTRTLRRSAATSRNSQLVYAYLFLFPATIGLLLFRIMPIADTVRGSFLQVSYSNGGETGFVWFRNFINAFKDPVFWKSLKVTLVFNLWVNPLQISLALILAILLKRNTCNNRIFRTLYMIPLGVSITVASTMWLILLDSNQGIVNTLIIFLGGNAQPFLTSPRQALFCLMLVASWCGISYWMLFLVAGLQEIPAEIYEAASIDGASGLKKFILITLPLLKRTLLFVFVADTSANFLLFAPVYVMTNGGPNMSTNTLMFEAYTSAFIYSDIYRSLTLSVIILIVLLIVILGEFRLMKEN